MLSVLWFSETLDEYNKLCSYFLNAVIRAISQQSNTSQIILLFEAIKLFDRRNTRICLPTSSYFPNIDSLESALPYTLLRLTVPSETLLFVLEAARISRHYYIYGKRAEHKKQTNKSSICCVCLCLVCCHYLHYRIPDV